MWLKMELELNLKMRLIPLRPPGNALHSTERALNELVGNRLPTVLLNRKYVNSIVVVTMLICRGSIIS